MWHSPEPAKTGTRSSKQGREVAGAPCVLNGAPALVGFGLCCIRCPLQLVWDLSSYPGLAEAGTSGTGSSIWEQGMPMDLISPVGLALCCSSGLQCQMNLIPLLEVEHVYLCMYLPPMPSYPPACSKKSQGGHETSTNRQEKTEQECSPHKQDTAWPRQNNAVHREAGKGLKSLYKH